MNGRLRYALATLVGPWLLLPALAFEVVVSLQRGSPWRGEGMWTVEWFAVPLFIIGPLSAAVAAVDAARLSRQGSIHLVVSVPYPSRPYLRAAAWTVVPLICLHALSIVTALLVGQVWHPSISWWAMLGAAIVELVGLLWYVALGSAIGRFTTPLLAGLVGGGVALGLNYLMGAAGSGVGFQLLDFGSATATMIGKTFSPAYLVAQGVVLAVTAALLLVLPPRSWSGHAVPSPTGVLAAVAAVALIVGGTQTLPTKRVRNEARTPTYCTGTAPQICLYYEHRRFAPLIVPRIRALTQAARAAGYSAFVPDKVIESGTTNAADAAGVRPFLIWQSAYEKGSLPDESIAYELIAPSQCPALRGDDPTAPPDSYDTRFFSLLGTFLHVAGEKLDYAPVAYRILSPAEAQQIMAEFARCDLGGST